MNTAFTKHAAIRAQQRGIPKVMDDVLDLYGREQHVGPGIVVRFMDKSSRRTLKRELDPRHIKSIEPWLNTYAVALLDGKTITIGHRTRRMRRK